MRLVDGLAVLALAGSAAGCGRADGAGEAAAPQQANAERRCAKVDDGRVLVRGGTFRMGSETVYAEEGPERDVTVRSFRIDRHEVTNREFAAFVRATGYRTVAERPVDPAQYPGAPADMLKPGSAVFTAPAEFPTRHTDWWRYVPGANWRKPFGPDGPDARPDDPVVHVAFEDAAAFARWSGGRLPTEAEWEYAARAGAPSLNRQPEEANSWQGVFPVSNEKTDGFAGVAPIGCYKPNAWGLYDMVGNVWEWTADRYAPGHDPARPMLDPTGPAQGFDPNNPGVPVRVIKGGSYLCAPNYCMRYRPAARAAQDTGLGTSNIGFRTVADVR